MVKSNNPLFVLCNGSSAQSTLNLIFCSQNLRHNLFLPRIITCNASLSTCDLKMKHLKWKATIHVYDPYLLF